MTSSDPIRSILIASAIVVALPIAANAAALKVLTMERKIDAGAPDREICSSFSLTTSEVSNYFRFASKVDEFEFDRDGLILPCSYEGTIEMRGHAYHWRIYAGGAGYLWRDTDVNERYLCKKRCCSKLRHLC